MALEGEAGADVRTADSTSDVADTEGTLLKGSEAEAATDQQTDEGESQGDSAEAEGSEDQGEGDEGETGAPEQYEDFTMPEGVELDGELTDELKTIGKELNLSQADAQRVADLGGKLAEKFVNQQTEIITQARAEWKKLSMADTEFGGDKLTANLAIAETGLKTFGTPELRSLLSESGLANHPEVIRLLYKAGKTVSEDTVVDQKGGGGTDANAPLDPRALYPNSNMN